MKAEIIKELKALRTEGIAWQNKEIVDVQVGPDVIERDGRIIVSGETENGSYWLDYYGEFRGGFPWINSKLEEFAKKHGMYWEWNDPGSISLCD